MSKHTYQLVIDDIFITTISTTLAKRSFPLPHHGNRRHITPQLTTKAHLHILPISLKPFDLLGFSLQQHNQLHMSRVYKNDVHRAELAPGGHAVLPAISECMTGSFIPLFPCNRIISQIYRFEDTFRISD